MNLELPAHPGGYIKAQVLPKGLSVKEAAALLGVGRPALSNLLNGNAALSPDMAARLERAFGVTAQALMDRQAVYDAAQAKANGAPDSTKKYVPDFLSIKAHEIEAWAKTVAARSRLAVFLRTLVNSTGIGLTQVDFPGNDDAERPGWDGYVVATDGAPWVPAGQSGWEFGCSQDPETKADGDYVKRTKAVSTKDREETTFVFVTPRRWLDKERWVAKRQAEGNWKQVLAFDSSDLEQWIEQSVAAQAWFAGETGRPAKGAKSLDQCWAEWANATVPPLAPALFKSAVESARGGFASKLEKSPEGPIIVAADSIEEGLAFVTQVFSDEGAVSLPRDRVVVFQEPGVLPQFAAGASNFIAVVTSREIERELAPFSRSIHSIVLYPRNAPNVTPEVVLEPLDFEAFRVGLEAMGQTRDAIDRLSRESGRSLTVLRRRLSTLPAIRTPHWASDTTIAAQLVRFLFAGAWDEENSRDHIVLDFLGSQDGYPAIEKEFQALTLLNDAPVWSIATRRGVLSKIDLLFAIAGTITRDELTNFFQVAYIVLAEDDPSLDLPEKDRWAAALYGKKRELSAALRDGIAETLVLLAVHGNTLFRERLGVDVEALTERLISEILVPLTARRFEAQERDLPTYAEASPDTFLKILEADLKSEEPASVALMRPVDSGTFARCARSGLLWALENLAWSPQTLARVVRPLGQLAEIKIEDNWSNKPIESLKGIFRAWMPQTAANLDDRCAALRLLEEHHPNIAWEICMDQFGEIHQLGHYSHKPRWRNDGHGHGEPLTDGKEIRAFIVKAVEMALAWKRHDRRTFGDLIARIYALSEEHQQVVWELIQAWANTADDADKAWVREKIRVSVLSERAKRRGGERLSESLAKSAKAVYDTLAPKDLLNQYEWLFRDHHVEMSADELQSDVADYEKREERIAHQRTDALRIILNERGFQGILDLAEMGKAASTIGWLLVSRVLAKEQVGEFLLATQGTSANSNSWARKNLLRGALGALEDDAAVILRRLRSFLSSQALAGVLEQAPFRHSTWALVDELDEAIQATYWSSVSPHWLRTADADQNEAVERLLKAKRPRAAFHAVHFCLKDLRPAVLYQLMIEIANGGSEPSGHYTLEPYYIDQAFALLDKSDEFSSEQMAQLEFPYIEALARKWGASEPRGVPHLEAYVEKHPELFVQAVAWAYKRGDDGQDPPELQLTDPEHIQNRAGRGYRFLESLRRIPGRNKADEIDGEKLFAWIRTVRQASTELARQRPADHALGVLLSHAPAGQDGVWPCEPVRMAMEKLNSRDISAGVTQGLFNARGAHWRGKGGDQERDLAEGYRRSMNALQFTHPFVASSILKHMVDTYGRHAEIHDSEDEIQRRTTH
jgi:addiction module HigA family antidote